MVTVRVRSIALIRTLLGKEQTELSLPEGDDILVFIPIVGG
jgi:hypothetical protein